MGISYIVSQGVPLEAQPNLDRKPPWALTQGPRPSVLQAGARTMAAIDKLVALLRAEPELAKQRRELDESFGRYKAESGGIQLLALSKEEKAQRAEAFLRELDLLVGKHRVLMAEKRLVLKPRLLQAQQDDDDDDLEA